MLTPEALAFIADLQRRFGPRREEVFTARAVRREQIAATGRLDFLAETADVRAGDRSLPTPPPDLTDRRVEITGPTEPKMAINALNCGAQVWLYLFHNAAELISQGSGPYFYLPKLEGHLEARLWAEVFTAAEESLGIPHGSIRVTTLIETITAAFEMEEMHYELRDHATGLNAGRWDYLFSIINNFRDGPSFVLPDRAAVTMAAPMMRAYTDQLVSVCHRRGAMAIGGMAALIPSRRDAEANERALAGVRADKEREAGDGFDGFWVAHPDLVSICRDVFDVQLGGAPNQLSRLRDDVSVSAEQLLDIGSVPGERTEAGLRGNIEVAIRYLAAWLGGNGAVGIHGLLEDAATAEISRSQVWQWIAAGVELDTDEEPMPDAAGANLGGFDVNRQEDPSGGFDVNRQEGTRQGTRVTRELVTRVAEEELAAILAEPGVDGDACTAGTRAVCPGRSGRRFSRLPHPARLLPDRLSR